MGSQIDELLEKYWEGKTSLEEEQLIKSHFQSTTSLTNEGHYFRYLNKQKQTTLKASKSSFKKSRNWLSAAATITIGLITAVLVFNDVNKDPFAEDDPQKAFEATRNALMMIGAGLNEGQVHAMELTKFNKAKNELQGNTEAKSKTIN